MSDSRKPGGKHLKKEAGLKVAEVLTAALVDLKEKLGEKKFLRNGSRIFRQESDST